MMEKIGELCVTIKYNYTRVLNKDVPIRLNAEKIGNASRHRDVYMTINRKSFKDLNK